MPANQRPTGTTFREIIGVFVVFQQGAYGAPHALGLGAGLPRAPRWVKRLIHIPYNSDPSCLGDRVVRRSTLAGLSMAALGFKHT